MIERIEGLVIRIVKHTDRHNVVTIYTRTRGRIAFLVPVGKSKSGKMRNSAFSLLAVVSADVNFKTGKELYSLRQVEPVRLWHHIYSNPLKNTLIFFLAEFFHRMLREYPADEKLWTYIVQALELLDKMETDRIANFHLAFLIGMLPLAGIEPPYGEWQPGDRFDMLSGEMINAANAMFTRRMRLLPEEESRYIQMLRRMNFKNMQFFHFSREQRYTILNRLLEYYSTHLPIGTEMESLRVLREMFDS